MGYRKNRHHGKNRFDGHNFRFKSKHHFNRNAESSYQKPEEKRKNNITFWDKITLRYKLFLALLLLNLLVYFIFNRIFLYVIILDILFVIIWIWGWTNTCPRCRSHWARKLDDRSNFGTHTEFENVTRNIAHRDSHGNVIGSSSVRDTRPITMHTLQNHWTCKYCGHSWSGRVHDVRG